MFNDVKMFLTHTVRFKMDWGSVIDYLLNYLCTTLINTLISNCCFDNINFYDRLLKLPLDIIIPMIIIVGLLELNSFRLVLFNVKYNN